MSSLTNSNRGLFAVLLSAAVALAGCGNGSQGSVGPAGPTGPTGPVTVNPGTIKSLTVTITGVSLGATSTVDFQVLDQDGNGFIGLPVSYIELTVAQLVPGTNGNDNEWQDYINVTANPTPGLGIGTQPTVEATTDTGGTLVDNHNGTYTYTLGTNITTVTTPVAVTYNPALTHRVAIALRDETSTPPLLPVSANGIQQVTNGIYDFQPSTGATTGILTQDMVDLTSCNACHEQLNFHGGPRQDPRYCVTCHNAGSTEPNSTNSLNFKIMLHKLHDGVNLPSVVAGTPYIIYGYRNSVNNFSAVKFPQNIENCTKCHNPADVSTPDAGNYATAPTLQACGSCHDDINFAEGVTGGHPGGVQTDNSQCAVCHVAGGAAGSVAASHVIPSKADAANFQFNILSVTNTAPGQTPIVKFSVTNPANNNAPYNIQTDPAFNAGEASRLVIDLAWSTTDYESIGSGSYPGQPVSFNALTATPNGDGTYSATSPVAIPVGTIGSGVAAIEGHPADTAVTPAVAVPVMSPVSYYAITDPAPVPRRVIVETANCQNCHGENDGLALHGSNRNDNTQLCVMCHNPDATDLALRPTDPDGIANGVNTAAVDGLEQRQIDFKYFIHAIHGAAVRTDPFIVYGYGNSVNNFSTLLFPGVLADCLQCHTGTTFEPPLPATVLGTTVDTHATVAMSNPFGTTDFTPAGAIENTVAYDRISPTASACSACHNDPTSAAHMQQQGASFYITEALIGTTPANTETCAVCHGAGAVADVAIEHGVP